MNTARIQTLPGFRAEPSPAPQGTTKEPIASPSRVSLSFTSKPDSEPVPSLPCKSVTPIQPQGALKLPAPTPSQATPAVPRRQNTHSNPQTPSTPPPRKLTHYSASPSIKSLDRLSLVRQRLTTFGNSPERTSRGNSYFTPPQTQSGCQSPHPGTGTPTENLPAPKRDRSGSGSSLDHKDRGPFEVTNTATNTATNTPRKSQTEPSTFTLRNLPRQKSQIASDLIPVSTKPQPTESAESFYDNYMTTSSSLEELKGTIDGLKGSIGSQSQTIGQLRNGIQEMHREVKLAIQQPPLPVPQLDDLRERMTAMAEGLNVVDIPGLHVKLDAMKDGFAAFDIAGIKTYLEELRAVALTNEPHLSPDLEGKLNSLASKESVEEVIFKLEKLQKEGLANLPLILEKVEALKEQVCAAAKRTMANVEAIEAPPAPAVDLSSVHAKLDTISALANSLTEQRNAPSSPPPSTISLPSALRNLSVFKNAHKPLPLTSQQLNNEATSTPPIPPDVRSL